MDLASALYELAPTQLSRKRVATPHRSRRLRDDQLDDRELIVALERARASQAALEADWHRAQAHEPLEWIAPLS